MGFDPIKDAQKAGEQLGKAAADAADQVGKMAEKGAKMVGDVATMPVRAIGDAFVDGAMENKKVEEFKKELPKMGNDLMGGAMDAVKRARLLASKDTLVVVYDGKSARLAAERTVEYTQGSGYHAVLLDAGSYEKERFNLLNNGNKVIIIGHNRVAMDEKRKIPKSKLPIYHGMSYHRNDRKCVLMVNAKALGSKSHFASDYSRVMSEHKALAEKHAIPLHYIRDGRRKDRRTVESQYDLLWVLFAAKELPRFLGLDKGRKSQGSSDKATGQSGSDPPDTSERQGPAPADVLLDQFRREALDSPYITGDYLQGFCKKQQRFGPVNSGRKDGPWNVLVDRGGWQIQQLDGRDWFGIFDPQDQCGAAGGARLILAPILCDIHARAKSAALLASGRLNYGIVLDGGGAKGAFQIGVWKWLDEHGGIDRFTGISGASVGALNALLFAQGDRSKAERLWLTMQDGDLTTLKKGVSRNLENIFQASWSKALNQLTRELSSDPEKNAGLCSRKKYESIARKNISLAALRERLTFVSLSALAMGMTDLESLLCKEYSYLDPQCMDPKETNLRKVLASAAFPGAYDPVFIDGKLCIDGGTLDNSPVYPLVKAGYREIVVIHLTKGKKTPKANGVRFWDVCPLPKDSLDWSSYESVFKISPNLTRNRMEAGYKAAAVCLKDFTT